MKKIFFPLIVCLIVNTLAQAQSPQVINYQAVVRNNAGDVIKNQNVRLKLSITEGLNGLVVYSEIHQATTNLLGLVNLGIGTGSILSGSLSTINWSGVSKYLKIEIDITGGSNFILMGSQQLVSVPYSLYANTAGNVSNQWQFNTNGIHYNLGKVGIGTASPDAKLTIQGDADGSTSIDNRNFLTLRNTSTSRASSTNMYLYAGNSNTFTVLNHNSSTYNILDGYADFGILSSTGGGLVLRANTGVLRFEAGNSNNLPVEQMRITNEGNIGIGTKTPKRKLELLFNSDGSGVEDGRFAFKINNTSTSNASQSGLVMNAGGSNNETTLSHVAPSYSIYSGYSDFGQLRSTGPGLVLQAPNTLGIIKFQTGGITERMRIEANGNVGIGTELPKAKLEVKDGDVYVNDPTKGIILKSPNGSCWRVTVDNTGNFIRTAISCPN